MMLCLRCTCWSNAVAVVFAGLPPPGVLHVYLNLSEAGCEVSVAEAVDVSCAESCLAVVLCAVTEG